MRIVFVSDDDLVNSWVVSQLAKETDSLDILRVKWWSDKSFKTRLQKLIRKPGKIFSYIYLGLRMKVWHNQREQRAEEFLWKKTGDDGGFSPKIIEVAGKDFNSPQNADYIRSLQPDLMVVCGGPILREDVFNIPRLGTLNIHFGVNPFYRGNHTILWPLFHSDFEKIGATIHQIDRGVDTGEVFARVYPELKPEDDEFSIEMKLAKQVTQTMAELLCLIRNNPSEETLSGVKLRGGGVQIYTKDLTLWVDAKYQLRRLFGLHSIPRLVERHELFYLENRSLTGVAESS